MASYNISLVILSFVVAVIGSLMALIATRDALLRPLNKRGGLIKLASLCLGGVAIWSMHFIGMLAYDMHTMIMNYNGWLTLWSLLVGIGVVYAGLKYMTSGVFNYKRLFVAGILVGLGVVAMHYTGILSMQMQADSHWEWELVLASVVIAVAAATAALWFLVHVRHFWQILLSALVMGVAVCGMHYVGMAAVTFIANPALPVVEAISVDTSVFTLTIVTIDMLIVVLAIAQAMAEANQRRFY